jgi:AhpD family alkylhydroperoxidase
MAERIEHFRAQRERLNKRILDAGDLTTQRFFGLDARCYEPGALDAKTKELLGLVASTVLRCDDCVTYHIMRCLDEGVTSEEFREAMAIALVVGGSITIPHVRRAYETWDEATAQ